MPIIYKDFYDVSLPSRKDVCYRCSGNGSIANPVYDGMSVATIVENDPYDETGFLTMYAKGDLNIVCDVCLGQNVIDSPDFDSFTKEEFELWSDAEERNYQSQQANLEY